MTGALHGHLTRQAERDDQALAVALGDDRWSYGRLERFSNQLAHLLREVGCKPGDRVALAVRKTPAAIAAMHAVLRADAVYVPIDVASPAQRVGRILAQAAPRAVLVDTPSQLILDALDDVGALEGVLLGTLDVETDPRTRVQPEFTARDLDGRPTEPPPSRRGDGDIAHILFTSGSTGFPKGVAITHANVHAFLTWALPYFGIDRGERISGHPPLHFDLSTFDVYGAMAAGASLHLVPSERNLVPQSLVSFIAESQLTQWFSVPSVLSFLVQHDTIASGAFPELRRLLWCGEAMPTPTLRALMERLPHVTFTNLYGPTEATIASSFHTVIEPPRAATEAVPIGVPCAGEELWLLGDDLTPTSSGEIGELYIGGVGLSPGYWCDDERTAEVFVPHPFDPRTGARLYRTGDLGRRDAEGRFYCLGRVDSQVKSRGYRIELGEIEVALAALDTIDGAAVVAIASGGFEGVTICCAFVAPSGVAELDVRAALGEHVPRYMVPTRWLRLERLPVNANGKVDRPALRRRFQETRP